MLLSKNSKMKNSQNGQYKRIYNFTLPALMTSTGELTCPNAGACAIGCYARQGAYMFGNVKKKHLSNFEATKQGDFAALMSAEIKKVKPYLLRIHDSGDFYSEEYLAKWLEVMRDNSTVLFYAYTKMVAMFEKFRALKLLPSNFRVIYSYGGKQDSLIDTNKHSHSLVFESLPELLAAGYTDTSHDDTLALTAVKIGLVYHGVKGYAKTNWNKISLTG